ncbi:hypothetical protein L9F63_011762, partial [Diploptera punctata]
RRRASVAKFSQQHGELQTMHMTIVFMAGRHGDGVTGHNSAPTFAAPPPPPPPPPPPTSGPLPSVRISSEIPDSRKSGGYEPPAAIQNAMMTKDKKPFTYTPGGLDLSQIRSPRMQRRITRNANAEGVGEHPQHSFHKSHIHAITIQKLHLMHCHIFLYDFIFVSNKTQTMYHKGKDISKKERATVAKTSPLAQPPPQGPLPPSAVAAMQPQIPVPVFPTGGGGPPQLHHVTTPPGPPPPPPQTVPPHVEPTVPKASPSVIRPVQSPAPSIPSPPVVKQVTVSSPTTIHNEPGSIYVPPVTPRSQPDTVASPQWQQSPQVASPMSPLPALNKAPTPWMSQQQRQQAQSVPSWVVNRDDHQPPQQQQQQQQQPAGTTRSVSPTEVEGRNEPQQQYQPPQQQQQQQQQGMGNNQTHTRIIPIQIEGSNTVVNNAPRQQPASQQQQRRPVYVHNKFNAPTSPQPPIPQSPAPYNHSAPNDVQSEQNPRQYQHQQSWGPSGGNGAPIQSRSFRVLQKITDTDNSEDAGTQPQQYVPPNAGRGQWNNEGVPVQQMRKLELNDDDRALMNKFRAQACQQPPNK